MRWGILFRREINLTFARIQDIHLTSNFVERWLGLARIQIQTASGSAKAEMTIEGIREARALRDFLYSRMRGAHVSNAELGAPRPVPDHDSGPSTEVAAVLREAVAELRAVRRELERRSSSGDGGGTHG
jgi:putative membrane protein